MQHSRFLTGALVALLTALLVACSSGGEADTSDTPTPAAEVTASPEPSPTPRASLPVGPAPGTACPVAVQICEFAVELEAAFEAGDADAFFALAHSVATVCTASTAPGGPSEAVCEGAAEGEQRSGFWDLQGGVGRIVTADELRAIFDTWATAGNQAGGSPDTYGPAELQVGSVSCTRQPDQARGTCLDSSMQVHMTFINPEGATVTGQPGERMSFHVSASVVEGLIRANGIGTVNPPNQVLQTSMINIQNQNGEPLVVEVYPWTR